MKCPDLASWPNHLQKLFTLLFLGQPSAGELCYPPASFWLGVLAQASSKSSSKSPQVPGSPTQALRGLSSPSLCIST